MLIIDHADGFKKCCQASDSSVQKQTFWDFTGPEYPGVLAHTWRPGVSG